MSALASAKAAFMPSVRLHDVGLAGLAGDHHDVALAAERLRDHLADRVALVVGLASR